VSWQPKALPRPDRVPAAVLVVGHDITDLQHAQRQTLQAERLAVIGQVTAALAHEGRNLLQRMQSGLERLAWRLDGRAEELALLARVQDAQAGLRRLFDDIRTYAAPLKLDVRACHLPAVWREAWAQVRAAFDGRDADLAEDAAADLWCSADPFRLGQVFRNLFENAFAACPGPVRVAVVCRDANLGERRALGVAVRDNGPGFTPEQRRRAFEPFFTTKAQGTGLGMSIARRIVEAHGGRIDLGAGSGPGAEIILFLPRD
jgi:signal transduction histidine kinase